MSKRITMLLAPWLAAGAFAGGCGAPAGDAPTLQSFALISPSDSFYNADPDIITPFWPSYQEPTETTEWYMGGLFSDITAVVEDGRGVTRLKHSNAWCFSGIESNALMAEVQGPVVVRIVAKSDAPSPELGHKFVVFDANNNLVSTTPITSNVFANYEVEVGPGLHKIMWTDARSAENPRCDWSVFVDEVEVLQPVPLDTVEAGSDIPGAWVVYPGNGYVSKSTDSHDGFGSMKITHSNAWCYGSGETVKTETKVVGPGKLSFWAKADVNGTYVTHQLIVTDESGAGVGPTGPIWGTEWQYFEYMLGAGTYVVSWEDAMSVADNNRCNWSVFMDEFKVENDQLFLPTTGDIVIEAESYKLSQSRGDVHKWQTASAVAGASAGLYVQTGETNAALATWDTGAELSYDVSVALPGTYRVWMRVNATTWADDSAVVGVDGQALGTRIDNSGPSTGWRWVQNATTVALTAGKHTVSLRRREDGYKVDRIVLTTDANFANRVSETLAEAPRGRPRYVATSDLAVVEAETFSSQNAAADPGAVSWMTSTALAGAVGSHVDAASASFSVATATNGATLDYDMFVPSPGVFNVWVRRWAPNGSSNSVFVTLNGTAQASTLTDNAAASSSWVWRQLGTISVATAGGHTLGLVRREPNYKVDRLILARDPAFVPSGTGPAASAR